MNRIFGITILLTALAAPCWTQQNWTGNGGSGTSLAILAPKASGLAENQSYIPALVQGEFVSNFSGYSAISVLDRVRLDEQYAELLSGYYDDNAQAGTDLGHLTPTSHIMGGTITKTSAGFALQIQITKTADKMTTASYSGTFTLAELDNLTGIRRASLDLLQKMGVTPTAGAREELSGAAVTNHVNAQTALAQGITAQRQGTEVAALSYYFQAAAFDPSLAEASNRSSILAANITSGNIGDDVRNDIAWRRAWVERLTETEQFFANFTKTESMPYTLLYSDEIKQGAVNYQNETVNLSIETNLSGNGHWLQPMSRTLQAVYDGLGATKRKDTWGLGSWPGQGVTNLNAFVERRKNFNVVFELLNSQNKVIGRQTLEAGGSWGLNRYGRPSFTMNANSSKTINFQNVNANDITGSMTIRVATVNGTAAETAARNGVLQIRAVTMNGTGTVPIEMVRINGGTFTMGSNASNDYEASPPHSVTLSGFSMSRYPVTQGQYLAVTGVNPSSFTALSGGGIPADRPVENVTWYDAVEFCNKLSQKEGLQTVYTISGRNPATGYPIAGANVTADFSRNGYRLPTEAQWEYACRAGTTTAYNTGDTISDDTGWYSSNSGSGTHEVGLKPPNAWGLYDMHGNVWEWCGDWYGNYSSGAQTNPTGAVSGSYRVLRGGSWSDNGQDLRSAFRDTFLPNIRYNSYGFRLVRP